MSTLTNDSFRQIYFNRNTVPFWSVHLAAVIGVIALGFSWSGLALAGATYFVRMFFVTAGYHRYFSHRSYKTSRGFQLLLALGCQASAQRGVLWWASRHREHHRHSDSAEDLHSPSQRGFWWAHLGWMLSSKYNDTDLEGIRDFAKYPELRALNRHPHLPLVALAVVLFAIGGAHALVWGFFVSTVLLWHGTFTINSLSHVIGQRRYATSDDSRNHWFLALITMGEGWHNNHHHHQGSASQGFFWWELDLTMLILRGLSALGLVWDLRRPPRHVVEGRRRKDQPITELVVAASMPRLAAMPRVTSKLAPR